MFKSNPSAFVNFQNFPSPQKSTKNIGTGTGNRSDGLNGRNLNSVTENNLHSSGNNGLKRTALMDSEEYVPPSKLPAFGQWEQSNTMNYGNSVFSNAGKSYPPPVQDDDIELDLVAEVAQTLHLDEQKQIRKVNPFRSGSKRKLDFAKLSIRDSEDDDEVVESTKRTKMDWDDQNSKSGQRQQTLAITERDDESREVFLSNEVRSLMSNTISPDANITPESIIIERIQKQNAMALVLWKPIQNIFEPSQGKVSYQNTPSKSNIESETDSSGSDTDSSDVESIIIEDPSGMAISNKMEED